MAVREVRWPRDAAEVARSLARAGSWFWLDGSAGEPLGAPGVSYLGEATQVRLAERGREREFLNELRGGDRALRHASGGVGGWVAAFGYEFGVALLGEDPADDDAPPAFALRADTVLVLDHANGAAELRGPGERDLDAWLERHGGALSAEIASPSDAESRHRPPDAPSRPEACGGAAWRRSDADYLAEVEACKEAIREGEAYVLCLTDTAECEADGVDPLELYLDLVRRSAGSTARGAVLVAGDRALVSASPERFLSKRAAGVATHPIKGTRPRGETAERDAILAAELAADPKERAENLMIVDLMRNDLSRVCAPGSVRTEGFLRVETHPRVHQLVSTVAGELREGLDVFDVLEACFPGGSMTGAPKRRAVQMLALLERGPRGLYSGCFGWLADDGDAELAMAIRCIELRGLGAPHARAAVGAGGGVTSDSEPAAELSEKLLKAAPLLDALARASRRYD